MTNISFQTNMAARCIKMPSELQSHRKLLPLGEADIRYCWQLRLPLLVDIWYDTAWDGYL